MTPSVAGTAGWLLTVGVHGALWAGLALGVAAALRHRALAWQEVLLRTALLAGLATGTLQWQLGGPALDLGAVALPSVPHVSTAAPAGDAPVTSNRTPAPGTAVLPDEHAAATGTAPARTLALAGGADRAPAADAAVPLGLAVAVGSAMGMAVLGVWMLLRAHRRLRRTLADRAPERDARVLALAAAAAGELGLPHTPPLSRSDRIAAPIAFAWLRPEVCLPARIGELGDDELRALFLHELAHVRRADAAWLWLGTAVHALFPWQLWLVPLRRRQQAVAELRCDAAATAGIGGVAVASCLVQVAGWLGQQRSPRGALAMAARPSLLRQRVERALAGGGSLPLPRLPAATAVAALLLLFTAAAPGVRGPRAATSAATNDRVAAAAPAIAGPGRREPAPRSLRRASAPGGVRIGEAAPARATDVGLQELRAEAQALLLERSALAEQVAAAQQELRRLPGDRELSRMLGLLEVRLAALARVGDRLEAGLARMSDGTDAEVEVAAPRPTRRMR